MTGHTGGVAPHEHLDWLEDNIGWFEAIPPSALTSAVPNCPGWVVEDVVNHLALGLGLAYPVAMSKGPDTPPDEVFVGVVWPDEKPTGPAAIGGFSTAMRQCLQTFSATDPDRSCWTYAGPGTARFWMRRAAIETTLHRMDVEQALSGAASPLPDDRVADAIAETVDFALPLAAEMTADPGGRLTVASPALDLTRQVGSGRPEATVTGPGEPLLRALWGRDLDAIEVSGDQLVATAWLSLIERAFAGR